MTTTNATTTRQLTLTAATDALCTVLTNLQREPVNYASTSPIVADLERIAEVLLAQAERTDEEFAQILTLPPCVANVTPIMPVALIQEAGNSAITSVERITNSGKVRTMSKNRTNTTHTANTNTTEKASKPELGSTVTTPSGEGIVVAVYGTGYAAKVNGQIVTVLDAPVAAPVAAPTQPAAPVAPVAAELPIKTNGELLREAYEAAKAARLAHGGAAKTANAASGAAPKASQPVKSVNVPVVDSEGSSQSSATSTGRTRKTAEEKEATYKAYWDHRKMIQREARSYGLFDRGTNDEIIGRIAAAKAEGKQPVVKAPKAPKAQPVTVPTVTVAPVVPVVAKPVAPVMVAAQSPASQPVLSTTVAAPAVTGSSVNPVSDLEAVARAIANSANTVKLMGLCSIHKVAFFPTEGKMLLARKLAAAGYRV